jgi:hypothetical protein
MRRAELPRADGGGLKKAVVVCYVPLLTGEPGRVLSVGDEEFQWLMAEADRCPNGLADACLWMADNGRVFPVFALPQVVAIANHLLACVANRPGDWFTPCLFQRQTGDIVARCENVVGFTQRFESATHSSVARSRSVNSRPA